MLNKNQITDVLERAVSTYVQTLVGLLSAAQFGVSGIEDLSTLKTCAVSALPAVLSVLKGYLAVAVPFGDQSASLARVGYERVETIVELVEVPVPAKRAVKKATAKKATAKKATAPRKSPVKKAGN
jgi:hypothetical protein